MTGKNYILMNGTTLPDSAHEEFRVAITKNHRLHDLFIDHPSQVSRKSNIYKGIIEHIEPSVEAVFVNYGPDKKHGFLPFKEIAENYLKPDTNNLAFKDRLSVGQPLMVQVVKDERGSKGAALTTFISLAGAYAVLMPNNAEAVGISRRIEGENREALKDLITSLQLPENMGFIIRTAGVGKSVEELQWDLHLLLKLWEAIQHAYLSCEETFLIHQESDSVIRVMRDYMREDIDQILVDHPDVFQKVKDYLGKVRPDFISRVKLYEFQHTQPLFSRFQIESQIEAAFKHTLRLPSGGGLVIDYAEALVAIDVNSARARDKKSIEETALKTNLEAAEEIARQLRLRDIGGLIIVDFIDMLSNRNKREVEKRMKDALKFDRARVKISHISEFGLLQISRQRLSTSLGEKAEVTCPRCLGHGSVRTVPSLSLSILRLIEEEALKPETLAIHVQTPIDVSTFLLNEKRDYLRTIEKNHGVRVLIIPHAQMISPHYKIERLSKSDFQKSEFKSYEFSDNLAKAETVPALPGAEYVPEKPLIKAMTLDKPYPVDVKTTDKKSFFGRLRGFVFLSKLIDKNKSPEKIEKTEKIKSEEEEKESSSLKESLSYKKRRLRSKSRYAFSPKKNQTPAAYSPSRAETNKLTGKPGAALAENLPAAVSNTSTGTNPAHDAETPAPLHTTPNSETINTVSAPPPSSNPYKRRRRHHLRRPGHHHRPSSNRHEKPSQAKPPETPNTD